MAAAFRTDPKLLGGPGRPWRGIFHFHVRSTTLATDMELVVGHDQILAQIHGWRTAQLHQALLTAFGCVFGAIVNGHSSRT